MNQSDQGLVLIVINRLDGCFQCGLVHRHEIVLRREAAAVYVGGVFLEGSDAFLLQALVFFEEVSVGFGVARDAFIVVGQDVVGEEELRITAAAGAEGHEEEGCLFANKGGELVGNEFQFGGVSAGIFQALHLVVELARFSGGFTDGANVGPGRVAWNHSEMANDGNAFAGHGFNDIWTGGAIDGAGAEFECLEADANCGFRRRQSVRGRA